MTARRILQMTTQVAVMAIILVAVGWLNDLVDWLFFATGVCVGFLLPEKKTPRKEASGE